MIWTFRTPVRPSRSPGGGRTRSPARSPYLITDLTSADATAADLARLAREPWTIEAQHHVRDVSFGEDHSASRTGNGPINLARLVSLFSDHFRRRTRGPWPSGSLQTDP